MSSPVYHFGDFRLDPGRFELLRKDHRIRLERKPLDLLILLASSDGRLVTRTEIAERLWDKEVFVDTEHGINTAVRKIRAVLRDDPEDPRFVQTVTGRGYRFIGPVEISGDLTTASASSLGQPPDPITPDLIREVPDQVIPIRVPQQQPRFHRILIAICSTIFLVALAAGFVAYNRHRTASALRTAATAHSANTSGVPAADHAEAERDYLQGRYLWYGRDYDGALLSFRRATELDPEYALPWTGLSIYYGAAAIEGQLEPRPALLLSRTTAQKAAALDPNLPEAHLALAAVAFAADWRWQDSLRELDRAVQLDPEFSEAYHFRAKVLAALGRHDEAIEAQRRAIALDPFARPWALSYSYLLRPAL